MPDQIDGSMSAMPPPSDVEFAKMVERAQAGDEEAIVAFIEYFKGKIRRYFRKQTGNDEVAEDLYSEMTEKVCKALPKTNERLRHPLAAKKWIFTIATNLIYDYYKACSHLKTISLESLEQSVRAGDMSAVKDWETIEQLGTRGAEEIVCEREESMEQQQLINEALKQVHGQLRRCFYMKDIQNLSHREIARALGIGESTARAYSSDGRNAVIRAIARLQAPQEGRL